jgi:outer membrane protein assembly factor BamD
LQALSNRGKGGRRQDRRRSGGKSTDMRMRSVTATRRRGVHAVARLVVLLPLLSFAAGCASLLDKEEPTEPDLPADRLYNEGVYMLNERKDAKEAAKKFEEVDRQHPYSEWARKALLMSAFAYYDSRQYEEAIGAAKRYISLHPGTPDAAYAMYLVGASYFDQIPDVSRDQGRTEKAIAALEEVTRKFPNSEYAAAARKKMELARDQLAAKEMDIGRFNQKQKNFTGAINRFKVVVTQYQRTRHVEEALFRLTECYMMLGIAPEAQTAAAVLGHNFPDSDWYKDAYTLVRGSGFEPEENKGSWMSKAFKKLGVGWNSTTPGAPPG